MPIPPVTPARPIPFDVCAADALERCARRVTALTERRAEAARSARAGWAGGDRRRFDGERARAEAVAADWSAACRQVAGASARDHVG